MTSIKVYTHIFTHAMHTLTNRCTHSIQTYHARACTHTHTHTHTLSLLVSLVFIFDWLVQLHSSHTCTLDRSQRLHLELRCLCVCVNHVCIPLVCVMSPFFCQTCLRGHPVVRYHLFFFNLFTVRRVTLVVIYALISFSLFSSYSSFPGEGSPAHCQGERRIQRKECP